MWLRIKGVVGCWWPNKERFIAESASEKVFKIGEYLAKLQARAWLSHALREPGQHTAKRLLSLRDTIRDAILTCARKPTWVSWIYRTEPTTEKCRTEKLKTFYPCNCDQLVWQFAGITQRRHAQTSRHFLNMLLLIWRSSVLCLTGNSSKTQRL